MNTSLADCGPSVFMDSGLRRNDGGLFKLLGNKDFFPVSL